MAALEGSAAPSAQVVGNAFVDQYYHILHQSPGLVHRFYHDSSLLSRPDAEGAMTTVTTMQAINDKILSLNYEDCTAEIKTADAQESHEKGVIVLVTGCLTGKDNVRKKFTQTFFLAPQDKGYYVLNDVFRFVEESESLQVNFDSNNSINENTVAAHVSQFSEPAQDHDHVPVDRAIAIEGEDVDNGPEVYDPSDKEEGSVIEEEVVEPPVISVQSEIHSVEDSAPVTEEDLPQKRSYASILKVVKGNTPSRAHVPISNVKPPPANTDEQLVGSAKPAPAPAPETSAPIIDNTPESNVNEEAEGYSIYVRNLPFTATPAQLEEAFKKFGPIKKNGIQVRSNKQGYCFGFVAFEMPGSVQSALEASPITIGNRQADVEAKRANSRVGGGSSGRGRFSSGRVAFRNDSFKGRANFGGGRGYGRYEFRNQGEGRNEFRSQGEFSARAKGSSGRNGEGRVNQNGNRRGGYQGGGNRSSFPG
ncbi:nuclear transport factor 2-like [Mangifera indica]|uniref:nuclear transport factor 2-like n=1 Tax=Mangifera indica TaxID=29780 RepID=UPI001CFC2665|nr:nuclear transport factor 2-like [Mangifera indica]